jgi:outer membrane protein assembly factor BamB
VNLGVLFPGVDAKANVLVQNFGQTDCDVTKIALGPGTDPAFSLQSDPAPVVLSPGQSMSLGLQAFVASASPPQVRKGTLIIASGSENDAVLEFDLYAFLPGPTCSGPSWPQWQADPAADGYSAADTSSLQGTVRWAYPLDLPDAGALNHSSVVVDACGDVYASDLLGTLYALDSTGKVSWQVALGGGGALTPALEADGAIVVLNGNEGTVVQDGVATLSFSLGIQAIPMNAKLDSEGDLFTASTGLPSCQACVSAGLCFIEPASEALTLAGWQLVQIFETAASPTISVAVRSSGASYWAMGDLITELGPPDYRVPGPIIDREPSWPQAGYQFGRQPDATGGLTLDETNTGFLFYEVTSADGGTVEASVFALGPDSAMQAWATMLPTAAGSTAPPFGSLAVSPQGTLYVGHADGLHALDAATGASQWFFPSASVTTAPAIGGDGTILFGAADGKLYAVTATGTLRFSVATGGPINSSPAIGPDGTVYFTSTDGKLYAVH